MHAPTDHDAPGAPLTPALIFSIDLQALRDRWRIASQILDDAISTDDPALRMDCLRRHVDSINDYLQYMDNAVDMAQ
jgi:hypothetical protein